MQRICNRHLHLQRTPYPPLCGGGALGGVQV